MGYWNSIRLVIVLTITWEMWYMYWQIGLFLGDKYLGIVLCSLHDGTAELIFITKISCLGGCWYVWYPKVWSLTPILSHPNFLPNPFAFATISLMPDFKGHKPKHNDHSCGVEQ